MTTIKGQVLASTEVDSHGEQRDKKFLEELLSAMPPKMPLNQHHDHSLPTLGFIENFRVEVEGDGWALKGDVTFEGKPPTFGGFSFSSVQLTRRSADPHFSVYLPYPYYRDEKLLEELAITNPDTSVGKWIKKSVEISEIALIVSAINLLFGPAWRRIYEDKVHPRLASVVEAAKSALQSGGATRARADFVQPVRCEHYEGTIELYFVPSEQVGTDVAFGFALTEAIEACSSLIDSDWAASSEPIRRIVHVFDSTTCAYRPTTIVYANGATRRIPETES